MSAPRTDGDSPQDSDVEQETAIDDVNEEDEAAGLVGTGAEATGYSSEEFEEDAQDADRHSTPVSESQLQTPQQGQRRRLSASRERQEEAEEEISRHSPFVPADSESSTPSPPAISGAAASVPARPPPNYQAVIRISASDTERPDPPAYSKVTSSRRTGDDGDKDGTASANSSVDSADESTAFLHSRRASAHSQASAEEIELQEVTDRSAAVGGRVSPPPYSEAVARVASGIAAHVETTLGTEVETHEGPTDEDARHVTDGRDEPPPGYSDVGSRRRESMTRAATDYVDGADVEANERVEDYEEPEGFWANVLHCIRCRRQMSMSTRRTIIITSVILCCLVMFVILFPFQFSYVEYYQFALVRTKSTGVVATDRVYEHGCYVLGADKEFVYLNRFIHPIEFTKLSMFTRDNVDLSIDVQLYYLLNYEDVGKLWRDYAGEHEHVVTAAARTTIRNCAARVSQDEYLEKREYVQELIHTSLHEKFADWGITIPYFNYLNLHLPTRVLEKKLKLLLIRTDIEKELAYQQQRQVELKTELLITPVLYKAKEAINNGTTQAAAIRTIAETEKAQHVDVAHANAFADMTNTLSITQTNHSLSLYYLATLNTMDHYAGAVEYAKRGLYMPTAN